jgi:hypothetical protein
MFIFAQCRKSWFVNLITIIDDNHRNAHLPAFSIISARFAKSDPTQILGMPHWSLEETLQDQK